MCRSPVPSAVLAVAVLLACASPKGFRELILEVPISPEAEAGAAFMEGHLLEMQGRLLEAVEAYAEAARLDPESAQIQRVLARVRARAGL